MGAYVAHETRMKVTELGFVVALVGFTIGSSVDMLLLAAPV